MNFNDFFQTVLFNYENYEMTTGHLISTVALLVIMGLFYLLLKKILLPRFFQTIVSDENQTRRFRRLVHWCLALISIIIVIWGFGLDYEFYRHDNFSLWLSTVFKVLLIIQFARLTDHLFSEILIPELHKKQQADAGDKYAKDISEAYTQDGGKIIRNSVYIFALMLILRSFHLDFTIYSFNEYNFRISNIFAAILIIFVAKVIIWVLTRLILINYYKQRKINVGSQFAINQLLKYIVYVLAIFMAIESLGINMTVLWGGAAALLVGVGLGLQQTFNDLISGIVLLFERSVEVGDVVNVGGEIGTVKRIGIRTSIVESRDYITVVIPNSQFINEVVTNWSHYDEKVRFKVGVGVAYGSDTKLVKKLLLQVARENIYVLEYPAPFVRFIEFGSSSLDFEIYFWSRNLIVIEDIKSDMRFEIDHLFRTHHIEIPFPQRDVWIKK